MKYLKCLLLTIRPKDIIPPKNGQLFYSPVVHLLFFLSFQIIPQLLPIVILLLQNCNKQKHNTQGKNASATCISMSRFPLRPLPSLCFLDLKSCLGTFSLSANYSLHEVQKSLPAETVKGFVWELFQVLLGRNKLGIARCLYVSLLPGRLGHIISDGCGAHKMEKSVGVVLALLGPELKWLCPSCSSLYTKSAVCTLVASLSTISHVLLY